MTENNIGAITEEVYNNLDPRIQKIWDGIPQVNQDIYNSVCGGMTYMTLSKRYDITVAYVRDIFNHTLRKLSTGINDVNSNHEPWACYFNRHIFTVLRIANICTFDELYDRFSKGTLKNTTRGLGEGSMARIKEVLAEHGYDVNHIEQECIVVTNLHFYNNAYYANVYYKDAGHMMVSFNAADSKIFNLRIFTENGSALSNDLKREITRKLKCVFASSQIGR